LRAVASIAWPSATSTLIGFWHQTSAPASHGGDCGERVPVVGRADQDDVEILLASILR
jgi:hypothetical protein